MSTSAAIGVVQADGTIKATFLMYDGSGVSAATILPGWYNSQEKADLSELLRLLDKEENLFDRSNLTAHFTASAWVVNKTRDKVLMAYHNLYDSWAWLGGHADGEEDLLKVAIKEVKEESGLERVAPVTEEIFSVEIRLYPLE